MWFSIENEPPGTQSEKPNRNYDKSWQSATISLVNVDLPFTIDVREIASRKNKQHSVQHLLDLTEIKVVTVGVTEVPHLYWRASLVVLPQVGLYPRFRSRPDRLK